ncbi:hypothetical protein [Leptospira terpstrae]|uniref:hypothetical protein n=1 Tax=Leptospira terpstrae TaxID=293075 RepID=UPI0005878E50|nr:hypothetical protein [Leptospira terpstrae]
MAGDQALRIPYANQTNSIPTHSKSNQNHILIFPFDIGTLTLTFKNGLKNNISFVDNILSKGI